MSKSFKLRGSTGEGLWQWAGLQLQHSSTTMGGEVDQGRCCCIVLPEVVQGQVLLHSSATVGGEVVQGLLHSSATVGGEGDQGQVLLHSSVAVDGEADQGQVPLHSSATEALKGDGGQGLRRGKVASLVFHSGEVVIMWGVGGPG